MCELIDRLPALGIRSRRPAAARPHVSLAVFDQVDAGRLSSVLKELVHACPALCLRLASIGSFPGDEGVVFLAPVVTGELLNLHARLHRMAPVAAAARRAYYLPGRWVPHCTIAEGLAPGDIGATVELARTSAALGLVSIQEIGLVQLGPYREISVYRIGQPPYESRSPAGR